MQDDEESIIAIRDALEQGIKWIDTAVAYGFGRSEQGPGRALERLPETDVLVHAALAA